MPKITLTLDLTDAEDALLRETFSEPLPGCYHGAELSLIEKIKAAYEAPQTPAPRGWEAAEA